MLKKVHNYIYLKHLVHLTATSFNSINLISTLTDEIDKFICKQIKITKISVSLHFSLTFLQFAPTKFCHSMPLRKVFFRQQYQSRNRGTFGFIIKNGQSYINLQNELSFHYLTLAESLPFDYVTSM